MIVLLRLTSRLQAYSFTTRAMTRDAITHSITAVDENAQLMLSTMVAMPWPTPMHMVAKP